MTILEILEAHDGVFTPMMHEDYALRCVCGHELHGLLAEAHRTHVAQVLDEHMQSVVSETQEHAWDEGYGDCWDFHRSAGMIGRETNPYRKETRDGR